MSPPRVASLVQTALCVLLLAAVAHADEIVERVMAIVGGELIMLSDVRAARDLGLVDPGPAADPDRAVLSQLIDRSLMLAEVERYAPPEPSVSAVDQELAAIRARLGSREAFDRTLERCGESEAQLRETVRENLRIREYLAQRFVAETPEQRQAVIANWVSSLRRRTEIVDLYDGAANP